MRWKTLFIVFLQGCACEFSSLDRISQIKTPYEKMVAEQEYERQKNEAKPLLIAETTPINITPALPTETTVVEKVDQIDYSSFPVNGESDKNTAGELQSIFFDFNWQTLNNNQKMILKQNAQELFRYPRVSIILSAHSDSLGNQSYNKNLSRNRALNVYKYLLKIGVPENRMSIKVAGNAEPLSEVEFKPIKTKAELDFYKKALSQNRRVNFIIDSIEGINEVQRNAIAAQNNLPREIIVNDEPKRALASNEQVTNNETSEYQSIYFPPSSARLSKEEILKLAENIKLFNTKTNSTFVATIYVKGINPEKVKQNMQLSADRAKIIYQQLLDLGVKEDNFTIKLAKIDDSGKSQLSSKEFRKVVFNEFESKKDPVYVNPTEKTNSLEVAPVPTIAKNDLIESPDTVIDSKESKLSEKFIFHFESKQKYLNKADEQKLVELINKNITKSDAEISFTLNTKGKTPAILSINQKLTDSRIKYIQNLLNASGSKKVRFINLKPDFEPTKASINYRSLVVQVELSKKEIAPIINSTLAQKEIVPTTNVKLASLQNNLLLNFESKKVSLENKSSQLLKELTNSLAITNSKINLELYIKGTKAKDIEINAKLTEKRKAELIRLFTDEKISKERLTFKLVKIDLEANRPKLINYRQLTITTSTDIAPEVAKTQSIELNNEDLSLVQEELHKETLNDSIADIIAVNPEPKMPENELKSLTVINDSSEIEFVSKSKSLTPQSIKKLEAIFKQLNDLDTKLAFTLFVKGSSPSIIKINQRLAENRKRMLIKLLKTYQINSNQVLFNLKYPDIEKSDQQFNGNYRLCLISQFKGEISRSDEIKTERMISSLANEKKSIKKKSKLAKKKNKIRKLKKKKPLR